MSNSPMNKRLSSSPFKPKPEPVIEVFAVGERVTHDLHGLGRVIGVEENAVAVDFGTRSVRVPSPYTKMHRL
ncbi:hypothetical protein [Nocardioides currus]|uniref:Uncharacterized protein n=1 Tax=Nocardioides currus TaxID=2133958 RepID=A0A2R7Z1D1_9ACTN|nr:hypothetical protein [Nocardioides currus]PUA82441.1 hypothetical protein C7S10_01430 [Nocardioides currus]